MEVENELDRMPAEHADTKAFMYPVPEERLDVPPNLDGEPVIYPETTDPDESNKS